MRLIADSKTAYDRFIKRVLDKKVVWCLIEKEHDYPVYCHSNTVDSDVFPFWSDQAYARQCIKSLDFETEIDSIQLAKFVEITLPFMIKNKLLVGPNWDKNLAGMEVEPTEVLRLLAM